MGTITPTTLSTSVTAGVTTHISDHNVLHAAVDALTASGVVGVPSGTTINATAAPYNMATGASAATNVAGLQAAINDAATAGGGTVFIPGGTYNVDLVTHPNSNATWTKCVAAIKSGVRISGEPANPTLTVLKLVNSAALQAGTQNRFFINWDPDADVAVDHDIGVMNITLNGNCLNVGSATNCNHGLQFWNATAVTISNCIIKNMRGENGGAQETFHLDFLRCQNCKASDVLITCDDGGNTASGFTANYSDTIYYTRCRAIGMTRTHGYTVYSSGSIFFTDCAAWGNASNGFNIEHCWDVQLSNCNSGTEAALTNGATAAVAYTQAAARGNTNSGFHFLLDQGGGRIELVNCNSRGNGKGTAALGGVSGTATTGTTASTVVATAAIFYETMIGRYIQLGTHGWFKVTGVNGTGGAQTTLTTEAAHGGASGDAITMLGGPIDWRGGAITGNTTGVQFLDSTAAQKRLTIRMCDLTNVRIADNTNDLVDIGDGSTVTQTIASGKATATLTSNQATTVEFYNPFPMDMMVFNVSAGGNTSLRGAHPKAASTSTGTSTTVPFRVPVGGAITVTNATMSNVSWWFTK